MIEAYSVSKKVKQAVYGEQSLFEVRLEIQVGLVIGTMIGSFVPESQNHSSG